ncbi:MAG TPA: hypothetical protein DF296_00115 [Candidatus Margulisbacteria bacterium]|nr:MAG: hypothetical protein A2X42_04230 [Candidatus Margulisbacteria bacterium GWF2_38_17]OGI10127.1 MAG: hypothetical protein A2X41_00950 [Candidatus Margulisbacteria bacterium GWE2_39_32]HCT83586.1 hypothetical protein [Candidatus Margulisiibacteriota bacterium]
MNKKISLFFFIDAFGWEMLQECGFLNSVLPHSYKLESLFGYSSACVPSILTGQLPNVHGYWSSFYYSPSTSPFKFLAPLSLIPRCFSSRNRVRNIVNRQVKKKLKINGYFNLYQFPFDTLKYYDYNEKINFYQPGSTTTPTIFDHLISKNIPYYSYSIDKSENTQFDELMQSLEEGTIRFSYVSLGAIDAVLHLNDRHSDIVKNQVKAYETRISKIYGRAIELYDEVEISVFSDHDMTPITETYDLMKDINKLGLSYGKDYAAIYDSTMARFWFFNKKSELIMRNKLSTITQGKTMSVLELKELGAYFEDNKFGNLIFLMNEGVTIIPSYMGSKRIAGMHGYHPTQKHAYAMYSSNHQAPCPMNKITDIFEAMLNVTRFY